MAAPSFPVRSSGRSLPGLRIGLLSTYPPKVCGLGTFAAALESALTDLDSRVSVVRVESPTGPVTLAPAGVMTLTNGQPRSVQNAATWLSRNDVAIVLHDFGIYGGTDGDEVLSVLEQITVPSMVVLHAVPKAPTPRQRSVLVAVTDRVDQVVVMSQSASARLLDEYGVAARRVSVIPHGAMGATEQVLPTSSDVPASTFLTWGFLSPGKGIEVVLDALAELSDLSPAPRYTVAGVTHPELLSFQGDEYRSRLMERSQSLGIRDLITFEAAYRVVDSLRQLIASCGVVILPYESHDQEMSATLVEAIAAGRPVIATPFPHAVELLAAGAGILVAHGDVAAMASAMRSVMTDSGLVAAMAAEARRMAPSLLWSSVASLYIDLARSLLRAPQPVAI